MIFNWARPVLRVVVELKRIANALEYFAVTDARANNRMYLIGSQKFKEDESELLHTKDAEVQQFQTDARERWLQSGVDDE